VGDLERSDVVMERSFWIGVYPGLTEEMLRYVVSELEAFVAARR
jgi:CDP-6-deoxy-D-xylo-4-hexulose-3-dehydrase